MPASQSRQIANWEKILAYIAAFIALSLVVFVVVRNEPFASQNLVVLVRVLLSLSVATIGATLPGFLNVSLNQRGVAIRAGGALALFVLTYFFTPNALPLNFDASLGQIEIRLDSIEAKINNGELLLLDVINRQAISLEQKNSEIESLREDVKKIANFSKSESQKGNKDALLALVDFNESFDVNVLQNYVKENLPQDPVLRTELSNALVRISSLSNPLITEASGLTTSLIAEDLLWTVNDSGDVPRIYAVSFSGFDRGSFQIDNVHYRDWEDLASYRFLDKRYLLIADTGDNQQRRDIYTIYRLEEPNIGDSLFSGADSHLSAERIDYVYSEGRYDAEAVAVDPSTHTLFIISKGRGEKSKVFKLELPYVIPPESLVAEFVVNLNFPVSDNLRSRRLDSITALDISRDGLKAAVLTYRGIYEYIREPEISWMEAFSEEPRLLSTIKSQQAEGISYGAAGQSLHIISEGDQVQLLQIDITNRENET